MNTENLAVSRIDVEEYFVYEMCAFVCHQHLSAIVFPQITVTHCPEITAIVCPKYVFG
jgi:hypothetical protein